MSDWRTYWQQAQQLKTPADRRLVLEKLLRAPWQTLLRIVKRNRTLLSRNSRLPSQNCATRLFFAGGRKRNVMIDVVDIYISRSRKRLTIEQLLICHEVRVSLVPNYYLIREQVLAAAGGVGGLRVVNVDEFLSGRIEGDLEFVEDFERKLPRLSEFKFRGSPVKCYWTSRGLRLRDWKRKLQVSSGYELAQALVELEQLFSFVKLTDDVRHKIQTELFSQWQKLSNNSDHQISLLASRLMNRFS